MKDRHGNVVITNSWLFRTPGWNTCDFYGYNPDDWWTSTSMTTEMASADSPTSPGKALGKGDSKVCGVCGDKALGYNFNAITCESCKAFFRRNALKKKEYKCPFNNNCKVEIITRRFCQKYEKTKIEENRHKRHLEVGNPNKQQNSPHSSDSSMGVFSPSSSSIGVTSPSSSSIGVTSPMSTCTVGVTSPLPADHITDDSEPETKIKRLTNDLDVHTPQSETSECDSITTLNSPFTTPTSPQSSINSPAADFQKNCGETTKETVNNVFDIAIKAEFEEIQDSHHRNPLTLVSTSSLRDLSKLEMEKLNELTIANRAMLSPLQNDPRMMGSTDPSLLNVINMTDIAIRRLIKMSKKITGFKNLCQEDQIALLKGGCTELMILRSVMTYDPEKGCWEGPKKSLCIKLEVLREAKGNVYEEHKRFIQSFEPAWRNDENIMLLLSAIALFNPDRANVIHGDVIKLEQDAYFYLLRRYLESMYYGCQARSVYVRLRQKLDELHILNENHVRVFLDVNPKDVEPLLIEIFDLKNH
uniref:Nuclear hormone receptor HR96 n=1 Tax=Strigamia maritima TaxID=126957 RepID=T1J1D7_STRMM